MAFFGMKLNAVYIVVIGCRSEGNSIIGCGQDIFLVVAFKIVGVQEVKEGIFLKPFKKGMCTYWKNIIPTHMGQFGSLVKGGLVKFSDIGINPL